MKYRFWILPLCLAVAACGPKTKVDSVVTHTQPQQASINQELLQAYHWQLIAGSDATLVRPKAPITLDFDSGRLLVSNSCNILSADALLNGSQLKVGQMRSTRRACFGELEGLDEKVSAALDGRHNLELTTQMQLILTRGEQKLVFDAVPTARTRFGSEPVRIFLEVAPQRQACSHPSILDFQCLQVRERHFDERGLEVGEPQEFTLFYDEIEGFNFEPGVRTVLRIDRYERQNSPTDASRFAYVLDMVIQSEQVEPSCTEAEFAAIEARLDTSDGQGHGPDIGSGEWQYSVMYRLGLKPEQLPATGSPDWCEAIQRALDARDQRHLPPLK
ncbi:MAG: META and DUF4377 domain-containing protein [Burkholderiales bacterium]|nr:META and DUF4377 domain-containing protein [Burkholderiales bacterium]